MIINSLSNYYDSLAENGEIARPGWSVEKVSYGAVIDAGGNLKGIISRKITNEKGKEVPAMEFVPEHTTRSSGISANFLCDSSAYIFGLDPKAESQKKKKRALQCFEASAEFHHKVLDRVNSRGASAVLNYFDHWKADHVEENDTLKEYYKDFGKTGFIDLVDENGKPYYEYPEIREAWQVYRKSISDTEEKVICLDKGIKDVPAVTHPMIKGIPGAQSSGAALITFNATAFESYGKDHMQGLNAPVSRETAFKYTTVLNKLIAERKNMIYFGQKTKLAVLFWAENAEHIEEDIFAESFSDNKNEMTEQMLYEVYRNLSKGGTFTWKGETGDFDNRFYVMGISPNNARLSVRFFLQNRFGDMLGNLRNHTERLKIIEPYGEKKGLPLWKLLLETVRAGSTSAVVSPQLEEQILKAILTGSKYPFELLAAVLSRIRTEKKLGLLGWEKAAIIKAVFLRNYSSMEWVREVARVNLNEETNNESYVLGRLFAVLEQLQRAASGGELNVTIKDRFFASAATTPGVVFPQLLRLAGNHEKKLDGGMKVYYDKKIQMLMGKLKSKSFPMHLNLTEQGSFYLGYYHQTQDMYTKKETKNVESN